MRIHWKKVLIIFFDIILAVYIVVAFTAFNKPDESNRICTKVTIDIQDETTNGFLDVNEIKHRLKQNNMYPNLSSLHPYQPSHMPHQQHFPSQ